MSDPNWNKGYYYDGVFPHVGMKVFRILFIYLFLLFHYFFKKLAREMATISYRSGPEWEKRFGRKRTNNSEIPSLCPDFQIETYLDHQV